MTSLTKPHCKLSVRAHEIAKHAADTTVPTDGDPAGTKLWRTVYRNVYEAAYNQGDGVPLWLTMTLAFLAIGVGYVIGRLQ